MTRYIGLDSHAKTCVFGVMDERGKRLHHALVETNAPCLVEFVKTVRCEHRIGSRRFTARAV